MTRSGHRPLRLLPPGQVRARGWLRAQLEQDVQGHVGRFPEVCAEAADDIFVTGRVAGGDKRHWWNGETEGKWIDGLVRTAFALDDEDLQRRATDLLDRLVASQDDDGYLGIYSAAYRAEGGPCVGDLWTLTMPLMALLTGYEATGRKEYLDAALRAALHAARRHGPTGRDHPFRGSVEDSMVLGHNLLVVEPVLWLFDLTGEPALLEFARWCYDTYSEADLGWPESDGQLPRLVDPATPFIGHGAHTTAQLRVPLLLHAATGNPTYRRAFEVGFAKMRACTGLSGACKSDEAIGTPAGAGSPLPEAGYEYCAMTELLHSLQLALAGTGDLDYAERAEWLALNAAQASRASDGHTVAYCGSDNQYVATKAYDGRWDYSPTHDDVAVCCNPSAARFLPYHVSRSVLRTPDDGLLLAFPGPLDVRTQVRGLPVTVQVDTDFPFDGAIELTVRADADVDFPLSVRVPRWARGVRVDGQGADVQLIEDRVVLRRTWSGSHTVRVEVSPEPDVVRAVDGTWAVRWGALLLSLDIPVATTPTRSYGVPGFADLDHVPADGARWDFTLDLDADDPPAAITVERRPLPDGVPPWSQAGVVATVRVLDPAPSGHYYTPAVRSVQLVPLGCTTLRRTTFPAVLRSPADRTALAWASRDSAP